MSKKKVKTRAEALAKYVGADVILTTKSIRHGLKDEEGNIFESSQFPYLIFEMDDFFLHVGQIEDEKPTTSIDIQEVVMVQYNLELNEFALGLVPPPEEIN